MELLREVVSFCLQLSRTVDPSYSKDAAKYQGIIARHYFDTQQVKESVAALQQLITIDRGNYEAYDLLGQTYQSVGEYEQASRVYRNLAKVAPKATLPRTPCNPCKSYAQNKPMAILLCHLQPKDSLKNNFLLF